MSRLLRSALMCLAVMMAAGAAGAAEYVVLDSAGSRFAAGQVVPGDANLGLAAGQSLTLMASDGRVVRVAGPAQSIPAGKEGGGEATVLASLTTMVKARKADTGTLGTSRAAGAELPDPWLVDVGGSGSRCLLGSEPLVLWRPDGASAAAVSLGVPARNWRAEAEWPAGSQRLFGPEELAPADGETLTVGFEGRQSELSIHLIPAAVTADAMRLAWLVERGCLDQAAALVKQLE